MADTEDADLEPDAISEFCKGFDQGYDEGHEDGWANAMASGLNRDDLAKAIEEYMSDGGMEFRAYDLADRIIKRLVPVLRVSKDRSPPESEGEGT